MRSPDYNIEILPELPAFRFKTTFLLSKISRSPVFQFALQISNLTISTIPKLYKVISLNKSLALVSLLSTLLLLVYIDLNILNHYLNRLTRRTILNMTENHSNVPFQMVYIAVDGLCIYKSNSLPFLYPYSYFTSLIIPYLTAYLKSLLILPFHTPDLPLPLLLFFYQLLLVFIKPHHFLIQYVQCLLHDTPCNYINSLRTMIFICLVKVMYLKALENLPHRRCLVYVDYMCH